MQLARGDLDNRIAVLMGGRAAEALIFDGEVSTGASDDLQRQPRSPPKWSHAMAWPRRLVPVPMHHRRSRFLPGPRPTA